MKMKGWLKNYKKQWLKNSKTGTFLPGLIWTADLAKMASLFSFNPIQDGGGGGNSKKPPPPTSFFL